MKYPVLKRHVSLMTALSVAVLFFSLVFAQEYREVSPETKVSIPGDFHFKDEYRVQWWYFTGHLINEKGREFGYELTFFVVNVQARDYKSEFGVKRIYISHFALCSLCSALKRILVVISVAFKGLIYMKSRSSVIYRIRIDRESEASHDLIL